MPSDLPPTVLWGSRLDLVEILFFGAYKFQGCARQVFVQLHIQRSSQSFAPTCHFVHARFSHPLANELPANNLVLHNSSLSELRSLVAKSGDLPDSQSFVRQFSQGPFALASFA